MSSNRKWQEKIPAIADHLAALTGETITVYADRPNQAILDDGRGLFFTLDNRRLVISGRYPAIPGWFHYSGWDEEKNERKQPPRITVSPKRAPAAIARDIARRFWPAYLAEYALAQEQYLAHVAREEQKASFLRLLAMAGAGTVSETWSSTAAGRHWRATVGSTVELRLDSLDIETACEIVELVAAMGR